MSLSCATSKTTFLQCLPVIQVEDVKSLQPRFSTCRNDSAPRPHNYCLYFPNLDAVFGLLRPESDTGRSSSVFRGHVGAWGVVSFLKMSYEAGHSSEFLFYLQNGGGWRLITVSAPPKPFPYFNSFVFLILTFLMANSGRDG